MWEFRKMKHSKHEVWYLVKWQTLQLLLLLFRDTGAQRGLTPLHQCYRTEWSLPSLLLGYTQTNLLSLVLTCRFSAQREMDWQRIDYFLTPSAVLFQKAPVKIKMRKLCLSRSHRPSGKAHALPPARLCQAADHPHSHAGPRSSSTFLVAVSWLPWKPGVWFWAWRQMRWLSVPCSQMGSLSCPIFSLPIVEAQPQKAKAQKGQTEKWTNGKGAKGRWLHKPAARLSASRMTYLAVCLCGMSDSILSSWLSASVITLRLSNYRK